MLVPQVNVRLSSLSLFLAVLLFLFLNGLRVFYLSFLLLFSFSFIFTFMSRSGLKERKRRDIRRRFPGLRPTALAISLSVFILLTRLFFIPVS